MNTDIHYDFTVAEFKVNTNNISNISSLHGSNAKASQDKVIEIKTNFLNLQPGKLRVKDEVPDLNIEHVIMYCVFRTIAHIRRRYIWVQSNGEIKIRRGIPKINS
jgi:hypothetical protein